MPTTVGISFFKSSPEEGLSYKARKSFACETLRLRRVAKSDIFLSAAVRSTRSVFYLLGNPKEFPSK